MTRGRAADVLAPVLKKATGPARVAWADQLRTLVIVLVVSMHACATYSHVGSWYMSEGADPIPLFKLVFVFWQGHLQSFFMGILFLLAGYFANGSLERRGPRGFVRERLFRLGLPTLLYMVAIHPLIIFVINPGGGAHERLPGAYIEYLAKGRFLEGTGPMWFAAALLLFCAALAAWRSARPAPASPTPGHAIPGPAAFWAWAGALVAATFLIRTVEPIGRSVLNMELCFFPQYVMAFAAGVASARWGWLLPLARSALARRAGWAGLVLGPVALAGVLVAGGVLKGRGFDHFAGGWRAEALGFAAWEQLTGIGLGLGAMAFCSAKLDVATPMARWLAERSFGVYLFHPPVLVLLALALRPLAIDVFFKISILTATGLVGSLLVADAARRVPLLRAIV